MKKLMLALVISLVWPIVVLAQDPVITITLSTDQTAPGEVFMSPIAFGTLPLTPTLLIINNRGERIYSRHLLDWGMDFKPLPNGLLSYISREDSTIKLLNGHFQQVGEVQAVGYPVDLHDFQVSPDGQRYLLMVYRQFTYDMSQIVSGGVPTATLISCLIQEVDRDNNLIWSWDNWDHTPVTHTNQILTQSYIDYDHCNSLAYDIDGNVLVSNRHLDSIIKINRTTGAVMWRLGGVANDFTFTNDSGFTLQHDARRLPNGHLTVFDNGPASRGYSRAVEYEIDETRKMITKTWEYRGPFALCCGNVQRLPNGNTLINWGPGKPSVTEVTPDDTKVFELTITAPGFSYRAFRSPLPGVYYFPLIFKK